MLSLLKPAPERSVSVNLSQSHRSAIIGSTFVARRAGNQQAASATSASNEAMTMKVIGSVPLTP